MIEREHAVVVVVDVQERMMPVIDRAESIIENLLRLINGCHVLDIPVLVTEQYSKGLGPTMPQVRQALGDWYHPVEKISFSACGELKFLQKLEASGRNDILVCGVETHVCVYQTARDLRELGYDVEIVTDAVGSRSDHNYRMALDRMTRHNIELTSVEMALFEMMGRADIEQFKAVSAIVK